MVSISARHVLQNLARSNNGFSSLRLAAMQLTWDKIAAAEAKEEAKATPDEEKSSVAMKGMISKLRLSGSPVSFWLSMQQEAPRGANKEAIEGHRLFCKTMADISGIVGHTCGVERAGKCYGLVMSSLRKSMHAARAAKCVYVFANYGLLEHKHEAGDGALGTRTCALLCTPASRVLCSACTGYHAFQAALNDQQGDGTAGDEGDVVSAIIRRGRLIVEDANSSGSESEDGGGNEGGDGGSGDHPSPRRSRGRCRRALSLAPSPPSLTCRSRGRWFTCAGPRTAGSWVRSMM